MPVLTLGPPETTPLAPQLLRAIPYPDVEGKGEFLNLFDFGDAWRVRVKRVRGTPILAPGAQYPRRGANHGAAPPQYADVEDA